MACFAIALLASGGSIQKEEGIPGTSQPLKIDKLLSQLGDLEHVRSRRKRTIPRTIYL